MSDTSHTKIDATSNKSPVKKMNLLTMMAICIGLVIVQGAMISATQGIGLGGMAFIQGKSVNTL